MSVGCGPGVQVLSCWNPTVVPHCHGPHPIPCLHPAQDVLLEGYATKYVGQALGGGAQWRGKLSETTDVSGNRVFRTTRTVAVPPGFTFHSVYRYLRRALRSSDLMSDCAAPIVWENVGVSKAEPRHAVEVVKKYEIFQLYRCQMYSSVLLMF